MSEKQELRISLSDANAKICELRKQNADLAEENLAAHLVNKEFADEVRELRQQFKDEIVFLKQQIISKQDALNAVQKLSEQRREMMVSLSDSTQTIITDLYIQLEASQKLSEERRVILALKYNPYIDGKCRFCFGRGHTDNCDYIRLIKEH